MKLLLALFNFVFWVSGVAVLALGVWMKVDLYIYMELTSVYVDFAPYILIGVGAGIIIFGSFGCLCTMKGHGRLLYIYATILILVFVVELATAGATFFYRSKVEEGFGSGLETAMKHYATDKDKMAAVDGLQSTLKCCGKNRFEEWYKLNWSGAELVDRVPSTCCISAAGQAKEGQAPAATCDTSSVTDIYTEGCYTKLTSFMNSNFNLIGGVAIGFAFLQLLGAILTCCLARNINKARYEQVD
jgi:tetraspanin-7